jgi:hypothetical protein
MLTRERVEAIMGRLDDIKMAEILATDASEPELLEARRWAEGYVRTVSDELPVRASVVSRLTEIIAADEPDWDDDPCA